MNDHPDQESRNIREINAHQDLTWNETTAQTEAREAVEELLEKGSDASCPLKPEPSNAAPTSNTEARRKAEHDAVQAILDKDRPDQRPPEARQSDTPMCARCHSTVNVHDGSAFEEGDICDECIRAELAAVTAMAEARTRVSEPSDTPRRKHLIQSAGYWFESCRAQQLSGNMSNAVMAMENAYNHVENALAASREQLATVTAERDKYRDDVTAISRTMHDKVAEQQREIARLKEEQRELIEFSETLQTWFPELNCATKFPIERMRFIDRQVGELRKDRDALAAKLAEVSAVIQLACQSVGMQPNDNFQTLPCVITMKLAEAQQDTEDLAYCVGVLKNSIKLEIADLDDDIIGLDIGRPTIEYLRNHIIKLRAAIDAARKEQP